MNSSNKNYGEQNQRVLYPNYVPSVITNQIQDPNIVNNINKIVPESGSIQQININPIQPGINAVNKISSQINSFNQALSQKSNKINYLPNQNVNMNQFNSLINNTPNIIYNQSPMLNINTNIVNNMINKQNAQVLNMIQGKQNQALLPYKQNINIIKKDYNPNINKIIINTVNNLPQNKIINRNNFIEKERKNEVLNDHPPIPMKLSNNAMKSICKISFNYKNKSYFGTGFFMKFSDCLKLLITNYHVIFPELMNINLQIEIWNNKKMTLNLIGRYIKFMREPKDITAIEIKDTDNIYKYIQFLNFDLNYNQYGYNIYNNTFVFSIEHPLGQDAAAASGKIINIYGFQFDHNIATNNGSSGCPIILLPLMMVIGIHKNSDNININGGTFIGEIINEIKNDLTLRKQKITTYNNQINQENKNYKNQIIKNNENYIIGEIYINDENINKKVRIINSYEEFFRSYKNYKDFDEKFDEKLKNEEKIKECEITINDQLISFNYFYYFKQKGKYIIKYKFKNFLTNTNHMFYECKSLIYLNLSNFKTQNVKHMVHMFYYCKSLQKVITADKRILRQLKLDEII